MNPSPAPAVASALEPEAGVLYLVGTPIGNLEDLSPRASRILAAVDRIACEDTRRSGLLLHRFGIRTPLLSFHLHNQARRLPQLLQALAAGQSLALISDAGLPGISDPGEILVAACHAGGHRVVCIPGPCALTTALVCSGLPSGRFCFEGFLPSRGALRRRRLEELRQESRTIVFYEAPHRLLELLQDILELLGDRPLQVARELTKRHEELRGPTVAAALDHFRRQPPQGECTVVLAGAPPPPAAPVDDDRLRRELLQLRASGLSSVEAARQLAQRSGLPRRHLYALLHQPQPQPGADPCHDLAAEADRADADSPDGGRADGGRAD